ncbi:MAG: hypothetical protein FJ261_08345 [Planctomycetes bacterium]|nr:hypothetical protein [Planctomycetota bacterium]
MLRTILLYGLVAMVGLGCGADRKLQVVKASGEVLVGGKPAEGALVVFHPQEKDRERDVKPFAKTDAQGKFVLNTYEEGDGATPGEYKVTIVWNKADGPAPKFSFSEEGGKSTGPDRLGGRYGNPANTSLWKTVKKGEANLFKFELN